MRSSPYLSNGRLISLFATWFKVSLLGLKILLSLSVPKKTEELLLNGSSPSSSSVGNKDEEAAAVVGSGGDNNPPTVVKRRHRKVNTGSPSDRISLLSSQLVSKWEANSPRAKPPSPVTSGRRTSLVRNLSTFRALVSNIRLLICFIFAIP